MKQQFSKISILATLMSLNFLHANQNTIININIAKPPEVPKVQFNISSVTLHTYNLQTKFEKKVRKKSNYIGSSKRIPPHYKEKQNPKQKIRNRLHFNNEQIQHPHPSHPFKIPSPSLLPSPTKLHPLLKTNPSLFHKNNPLQKPQ